MSQQAISKQIQQAKIIQKKAKNSSIIPSYVTLQVKYHFIPSCNINLYNNSV